jgi:hypothetical protein
LPSHLDGVNLSGPSMATASEAAGDRSRKLEDHPRDRSFAAASCGAAVIASAVVQSRLLSSYFSIDEWQHFFEIEQHGPLWFVFARYNDHFAPLTKLLILGSYTAFGFNPAPYFVLMLGVHLANVALLWRLIHYETGAPMLAALASALWGASAFQYNALDHFSSFAIALVTLLMLVGLLDITRLRLHGTTPTNARLLGWATLMLSMTLSTAMGIALAVAIPIVVALSIPKSAGGRRAALLLGAWAVVLCASYVLPIAGTARGALGSQGSALRAPAAFAVIVTYGAAAVVLAPLLQAVAFRVAIGPLAPLPSETLFAWTALSGCVLFVAAAAAYLRLPLQKRKSVIYLMAIGWGQYAGIAIGRAALFDNFLLGPGSLHNGRYHYVGTLAFTAVMAILLSQVHVRWRLQARVLSALVLLSLVASANRAISAYMVNPVLQAAKQQFPKSRARLSQALATAPAGPVAYLRNVDFDPVHRPLVSIFSDYPSKQHFPGAAGLFLLLYPSDAVDGRTVRFIEPDAEIVRYWRKAGGRIAALLVSPAEVATPPSSL